MDLSKYEDGAWISELGKYKKTCKLRICNIEFAGRANREFCSDPCKAKHNNDKKKELNSLAKRYSSDTLKANKIFHDLIEDYNSTNYINKQDLLDSGYTRFAPGRRAKYNKYHGEWWCIGSFAHRLEFNGNNELEFIYVKS